MFGTLLGRRFEKEVSIESVVTFFFTEGFVRAFFFVGDFLTLFLAVAFLAGAFLVAAFLVAVFLAGTSADWLFCFDSVWEVCRHSSFKKSVFVVLLLYRSCSRLCTHHVPFLFITHLYYPQTQHKSKSSMTTSGQ